MTEDIFLSESQWDRYGGMPRASSRAREELGLGAHLGRIGAVSSSSGCTCRPSILEDREEVGRWSPRLSPGKEESPRGHPGGWGVRRVEVCQGSVGPAGAAHCPLPLVP